MGKGKDALLAIKNYGWGGGERPCTRDNQGNKKNKKRQGTEGASWGSEN